MNKYSYIGDIMSGPKRQPDYKERHKYACHKSKAKSRGIPFNITYEEWFKIWQDSGHWHERGCKAGQYVMSRKNDTGAYEVDNVFIQLHKQNLVDAHAGKPSYVRTPEQKLAQILRVNKTYKGTV